jgi:predicted aspartyl protease
MVKDHRGAATPRTGPAPQHPAAGLIARVLPRLWRLLAVLALAASSSAAAQPVADEPYQIAYSGRIAVQVYLNGKGPFDFLVDTAATRTILYERARARLGEPADRSAPISIFGIAGDVKAPSLRLQELRIDGARIENLLIAVVRESPVQTDEPDGILGLDVLRRYFLVLDRPAGRLRLYAHASDAPPEVLSWSSLPMNRIRPRRLPVELWAVDGVVNTQPMTAVVDLGAGVTILNWELARQLGFREDDFIYSPLPPEVQDVLGKTAPVVLVSNVRLWIDHRFWGGQEALVADAPIFRLLDLHAIPAGLIGPGLFAQDSLAIDFEHRRLYLAPPAPRPPRPKPAQ